MTATNTPNFENKTIWVGDNLSIMRRMNSGCVDLIYLDPPFNSNVDYAAPIGSKAAGAEFKDTWSLSDIDTEWVEMIEKLYPPPQNFAGSTQQQHEIVSYLYGGKIIGDGTDS